MSYLIYINGQLIEAPNVSFAQTKQVNDIANLSNRNSNYTQSIKIPRTAKNIRIFSSVGFTGSQSNLPYIKATCNVIDADTGQHVIYNGWAVLLETTEKEYSITIYDGVIDFYKSIDNLTITECGVSELNHIKKIDTVIGSWEDEDLPYRYILADYNGNNNYPSGMNIDFQVPCASVSYLWDKIFEYVGYTYEGSIFGHEYFQNLWLSYPKPVSEEEPELFNVTNQDTTLITNQVEYPNSGGTFYGSTTFANFFPDNSDFDSAYYTFVNGATVSGLFRLRFEPATFQLQGSGGTITSSRISVSVYNSSGTVGGTQFINIANGNYVDVNLGVGDKILVQLVREDVAFQLTGNISPTGATFLSGTFGENTIDYISGFNLGFDEAFIDFKVSDFIKEIVVRFGLTMFKDKYTNNVRFLTLAELLQGQEINNLTDKFIGKVGEKYTFGSYAKSNVFRYKYNDDEATHNNGSIKIENDNLPEEYTIIQSNIYSPERLTSINPIGVSNIYKIWDKEIKDDESVTYKDLDGRFYFLRAEKVAASLIVGSNTLGTSETVPFYFRESYHRLKFTEIIFDWYRPIGALFNKAKLITAEFFLKAKDVFDFPFDKLIYIEQLSSYYLVNKINNIIKGKPTKVELIEVDYFTEIPIVNPPAPSYTVAVSNPVIDSCMMTLDVTTDYPTPDEVFINVYEGVFNIITGVIYTQINLNPPILATIVGGQVTFPLESLPYNFYGYKFGITLLTDNPFVSFSSGLTGVVAISGDCYSPPTYPTTLTLNSVIFNGSIPNPPNPDNLNYTIDYSYTGMPLGQSYTLFIEFFASFIGFPATWHNIYIGKTQGQLNEFLQTFNIQGLYSQPTKFRLKINSTTSNEITI